jgi:hypothetical protein
MMLDKKIGKSIINVFASKYLSFIYYNLYCSRSVVVVVVKFSISLGIFFTIIVHVVNFSSFCKKKKNI